MTDGKQHNHLTVPKFYLKGFSDKEEYKKEYEPGEIKHKHHIVPKFYLRGFSKKEKYEKVAEVKLPGNKPAENPQIGNTAYITDYYTVGPQYFGPDSHPNDFENWLDQQCETPAGKVFQKINKGEWPLEPNDRITLAKFIALQIVRVPAYRDFIRINNANIYAALAFGGRKNLSSGILKYFEVNCPEELLDEIWSQIMNGTFRIEVTTPEHLFAIIDTVNAAIDMVLGRPWFLAKFSDEFLFTSDNPVVLTSLPGIPTGLRDAPELLFPFSRRSAIIMRNPFYMGLDNYDPTAVRNGTHDVSFFGNEIVYEWLVWQIINNAQTYLYCHPDDRENLPKDLPQPKQPRNFKNEMQHFIEMGESFRSNKNLDYDDTPDDA